MQKGRAKNQCSSLDNKELGRNLGWSRDQSAILQSVQSKSIPATHAGFLEDVLQMDFDSPGTDAQILCDLLILEALLHQLQHLLLARSQLAARITFRAGGIAKQ